MRTIGVYLIFFAVVFRSAVVYIDNPQLILMIIFRQAGKGLNMQRREISLWL